MIKSGGVRTIRRKLKYLKSGKTRKVIGRNANAKKTLKSQRILGINTKNLEQMIGMNKTTRKMGNIKMTYEKTKNIEDQMIQTSDKFIKLFNKILHNEPKYVNARVKIESMLEALDSMKGDVIERFNITNQRFKSKLERKITDDKIRTYRNVLKVAQDTYETTNNEEQREAASILLTGLIEELYKDFFTKSKNGNMNMEDDTPNNNLGDLLNMFKKTAI